MSDEKEKSKVWKGTIDIAVEFDSEKTKDEVDEIIKENAIFEIKPNIAIFIQHITEEFSPDIGV